MEQVTPTVPESGSASLGDLTFVDPQRAGGRYEPIPAPRPDPWPLGEPLDLSGFRVAADGRMLDLGEFSAVTSASSLVVVAAGELRHEWYAPDVSADSALLGASMTKSVLAHLVGLAVADGRLALDVPVTTFVPELAASGYRDVRVGHLLSMTSGVQWTEDYRDPGSPASRLLGCFAAGSSSSRDLLCKVESGVPAGSRFAYNTADSQVLDWVRERATGQTTVQAIRLLWADLGCTRPAWMLTDRDGVALAGGGLAACATDWARIGVLQLYGSLGRVHLPAGWRDRSSRPSEPFLCPGRLPSSITTHAGFGYHWWPLDEDGHRVTADGSRGQFCYLDTDREVVVVKTSRWSYGDFLADRTRRDLCYLTLPALAETY
ncbi:MAG: serine hydrolase domain-containing protein [Actinomycetales bacterium]